MVNEQHIQQAADALRAGLLVAFPTETVYGLGADAASEPALGKLYAAKGRPVDHPVIVHVAQVRDIADWACDIPPAAELLARAFWPGPLTLILRRRPHVLDAVTGGQDTVALRVPSHPVAQRLLRAFGGGIAAPSANRFGRISATTAGHVHDEFGAELAMVLDAGASEVGIESTIVDVSGVAVVLLRPGGIPLAELARVLGRPPGLPDGAAPRAPGTLAAHYAPRTPLMLVEPDLVIELATTLARQGQRVAVLARSAMRPVATAFEWLAAPQDSVGYAHVLYASLRDLDARGCEVIVVEAPPDEARWTAIRDRLRRAATSICAADC